MHFGHPWRDDRYLSQSVRLFFENGGSRCFIARVIGEGAASANLVSHGYRLTAQSPGSWGNRIWARLMPASAKDGADAPENAFTLEVGYWDNPLPEGTEDPFAFPASLPRPSVLESHENMSFDADDPDYWGHRLAGEGSTLISMDIPDVSLITRPLAPVDGAAVQPVFVATLTGGVEGGEPHAADFEGKRDEHGVSVVDAANWRGLAALESAECEDTAIVHAPGIGNATAGARAVQAAVVRHCVKMQRFAVLDSALGSTPVDHPALTPRDFLQSDHAAFYYPWIVTTSPDTGATELVPPGGAVCGIYARVDQSRGVWHAPAGQTAVGVEGLEFDITTLQQEVLNPLGVNCLRRFEGRGVKVWGARTLSAEQTEPYVNVSRLLNFVETSVRRGLEAFVFAPNEPSTWGRVRAQVMWFLGTQWRNGAFRGDREEEAFFVNAGRDTMTEDDILNGRLIVEIGIAPVRPAEFVVLHIHQKIVAAPE